MLGTNKNLAARGKPGPFRWSPDHNAAVTFLMVLRGLPWNSTSQAFDEVICIAQLRGFDIKPLLQLSGRNDVAMKLLMKMQHSFPRNYVFAKARRMAEDGYGWAPLSF